MRPILCLFLSLVMVAGACGQTPPPKLPDIHFPNPPAPKPPKPAPPTPGSAFLLKPGVLYVVTSDGPVAMVASPSNVVSVVAGHGPVQIFGTFSDGNGTPEFRTFKEPNLYIVTATATGGSCELIGVRSLTDLSSVSRQAITTAVVPPDPGPGPGPEPNPVIPIPSDKLRVLCIWESAKTLTPSQVGVLNSTIWKADVTAAGGEERVFDKDTNVDGAGVAQFWKDAMKRSRKEIPWVIMSSPKGFYEGPLPATVTDMQAQIKKVGG